MIPGSTNICGKERDTLKLLIFIYAIIVIALILPTVCADPSIIIYDYELTPKIFMPGDYGTLKLTIKNAETTNTIARTTTGSTTTTVYTDMVGATFNNIWIIPASDNYGKKVKATLNYEDTGYLAPSASFDITFKMIVETGITDQTGHRSSHVLGNGGDGGRRLQSPREGRQGDSGPRWKVRRKIRGTLRDLRCRVRAD